MSAELFEAIKRGARATVDSLLAADPGLAEAREPDGTSAVLTSLYYGKPEICVLLLARKPRLDIFEAAATGDLERTRKLLDDDPSRANGFAEDGFHPLGLAAFFKRPEVARLLLERGADPARLRSTPRRSLATRRWSSYCSRVARIRASRPRTGRRRSTSRAHRATQSSPS